MAVSGLLAFSIIKWIKENLLRRQAEEKAQVNEDRFQGLIENSALVLFTTDSRGNFTYLAGKCKDLTGFSAEELAGENFNTIVEDSWKKKVQEFYLAQIQKRTFETVLEFPIVHKNGERKWIEQSVVLLQQGGKTTGFQSIAKDITERKYAERLLLQSEQKLKAKQEEYQARLQAILDNMPMIVYLKDLDGNFLMVNRQFHQTFNTTDSEVIGKRELKVHLTEESAQKFLAIDEEIKNTLQPVELEDLLLTTEGERNMAIVKFPLLDKDGRLLAISAVGRDVTENIRYQQQLIEARERAERAERLQEEFLANMSHEIRTPMNGVIGMANLLETTTLDGEQKDYLRLMKDSSQILLTLINDILDLSKIKAGRMTVENIDYDLRQTVETVSAPFAMKAKEKGIALNKTIGAMPKFLIGDQHKLIQILNNLLSNAVKFTEAGSVSLTVHTEVREDDKLHLICAISDTGIGISSDNLQHIFESFVQAGNDTVRRFGGTGLGLAITKRLIELQGGSVEVESELGKGTTFRIQLPVSKSSLLVQTAEATPMQATDNKALRFKKVLLVEDSEVNQKITFLMLHKAGILVDIATHGKEAVAFLEEGRHYDLIITDLQMPEMDGFQTAQYIRTKLGLTLPIIAMTASAMRNERAKCFQLGMNEYLTKPCAPNILFHHLRRLLLNEEEQAELAMSSEQRVASEK